MLLLMQRMLTVIQMIVTITIVIKATRIVAILVTNNKKWCQQPQNLNLQPYNQEGHLIATITTIVIAKTIVMGNSNGHSNSNSNR